MNIGNIEIDDQKIMNVAMAAALHAMSNEIERIFEPHWSRSNPHYDNICKYIKEVVEKLIASPEFKAEVESACKEEFIARAKQKIANAVERTSVAKLRGE